MNNAYQIVSESAMRKPTPLAIAVGAGIGYLTALLSTKGAWILDKKVRTQKILERYPTPNLLRERLIKAPDKKVHKAAEKLRDGMTPLQYKNWIDHHMNPKRSFGKLMLCIALCPISTIYSLAKTGYYFVADNDKVIDSAIKNKYI